MNIPGAEYALTSDGFLNLKELPKLMLFIGGGYIAFEFAHIAARCGSKVTIMDMEPTSLPHFENEIVQHLIKNTKELGIDLIMNTRVSEIKKKGKSFIATGSNGNGEKKIETEIVFNTSGRVPNIMDINLEKGNVRYSSKGIEVNEFMQSISNPNIYAAGDNTATDGLPLTPFATMEGHIVASNILNGNNKKPDYKVRPTVVFTLPSLATVGMTESEAREKGVNIKVNYKSDPEMYNAKHRGEKIYAYKVIIDQESDLILGAHIIGPNAEETINLFAMAMKSDMKASDMKIIPFTFPSASSDLGHML